MVVAAIALVVVAVLIVECARVVAGLRRAVRLNRSMHELRRPLQSIALSIEGRQPDLRCAEACLEQARAALADLDAAINRRTLAPRQMRTALEEITAALERRWSFAGVRVSANSAGRAIEADPDRIAAALDNLVSNAVEHGSGPVSVRALASANAVRFEVRDGGPAASGLGRGNVEPGGPEVEHGAERPPAPPDPRRGHGLRVATEAAASQGGTIVAPRSTAGGETLAALSLPLRAPTAHGPGSG